MPQNDEWLEDLYAEGATDRPPSALDAKILAAATAAAAVSVDAGTPPSASRSRRYARWATAAVILLTVGVLVDSQLGIAPGPASDLEVMPASEPLLPSGMAKSTQPQPQIEEVVVTGSRTRSAVPAPPPAATLDRGDQQPADEPRLALRAAAHRRSADAADSGCEEVASGGDYRACQALTILRVQHPACAAPLELANASLEASSADGALLLQQSRLFKARCVEERWVVEAQ